MALLKLKLLGNSLTLIFMKQSRKRQLQEKKIKK